jgi:hypothetical protein
MTSQRLAFCALGLLGITQAGGCSGGQCPTIACQPQVQLTYARPITGPYHIAISYRSMSFEADCPGAPTASPGITSCDGSGVLVTGVDLGHGANDTVDLTVSIDSVAPITTSAMLERILNGRDCDLVCFAHQGTVAN